MSRAVWKCHRSRFVWFFLPGKLHQTLSSPSRFTSFFSNWKVIGWKSSGTSPIHPDMRSPHFQPWSKWKRWQPIWNTLKATLHINTECLFLWINIEWFNLSPFFSPHRSWSFVQRRRVLLPTLSAKPWGCSACSFICLKTSVSHSDFSAKWNECTEMCRPWFVNSQMHLSSKVMKQWCLV